jgi:iron complex outermembrane recepter protein
MRAVLTAVAFMLAMSGVTARAADSLLAKTVNVDIPAQQLTSALIALSKQAQIQVVMSSDVVDGLRTQGVRGQMELRTAIAELLQGTKLGFRPAGINTIGVGRADIAGRQGHAAGEAERPSNQILAEADASSASPRAEQAGTDDETSSEPHESEAEKLEEVVVTAQKRVERLQEVPISISVLSGEELDKSSVPGITEALRRVPGVVVMADSVRAGGTQLALRGVAASGPTYNGASPVGYYLDSVPMVQIRQAFVPDSNAFDLERVEVLRGPQGTLYGVNAENGLVRVLTRSANLNEFELKARSTLSSTDQGGENYRGDLALNVPLIAGKLGVRAVAGYQSLAGWIDQPNDRDINDEQVRNYRLKLNAQPTEALSVGLSAWRSNGDRGASSVADDDGRAVSVLDQPAQSDFEAYSLNIGYDFSRVSLTSMTSYVDYGSSDVADLTSVAVAFAPFVDFFIGQTFATRFWSKTLSQELLINSTEGEMWRWTVGAFYRDTTDQFSEDSPVISIFGRTVDTAESYAVFGELSRRFLNRQLEWTLGLRYFNDETTVRTPVFQSLDPNFDAAVLALRGKDSSHAATPRTVLTWYPNSDLTVYGSYSEGFRSGLLQTPPVAIGSSFVPPVRPDKLHNYEIGAKGNVLSGRLTFDAAVYFIDWDDVQQNLCVPNPAAANCFITVTNGESASGPGIDLGMTVRLVDRLDFGLSVSWNDLQFDESVVTSAGFLLFAKGDRLGYSSERTAGAFATYGFPIGNGLNGSLSASTTYSSRQIDRGFSPAADATIIAGDSMLIGRASFAVESADDRWTATLFVDNVNNWDGSAGPASTLGNIPLWYPRVRPRTIGVQLDYRFK